MATNERRRVGRRTHWLANAFGLTGHFVARDDDGQVEQAQVDGLFERCPAARARVVEPVVGADYRENL